MHPLVTSHRTAQHIHAVTDVLTTATGLQPGYREHRLRQVPEPAFQGALWRQSDCLVVACNRSD